MQRKRNPIRKEENIRPVLSVVRFTCTGVILTVISGDAYFNIDRPTAKTERDKGRRRRSVPIYIVITIKYNIPRGHVRHRHPTRRWQRYVHTRTESNRSLAVCACARVCIFNTDLCFFPAASVKVFFSYILGLEVSPPPRQKNNNNNNNRRFRIFSSRRSPSGRFSCFYPSRSNKTRTATTWVGGGTRRSPPPPPPRFRQYFSILFPRRRRAALFRILPYRAVIT